ncbi:unnamed protein product [Rangifer tarandus platyrhynchus]|uniref:Uncharacterized protein n=1 Tax=Rangifer tarandus platyrhynchus TaxID=3082113 RepID=A0AC59ZAL0_RANTA
MTHSQAAGSGADAETSTAVSLLGGIWDVHPYSAQKAQITAGPAVQLEGEPGRGWERKKEPCPAALWVLPPRVPTASPPSAETWLVGLSRTQALPLLTFSASSDILSVSPSVCAALERVEEPSSHRGQQRTKRRWFPAGVTETLPEHGFPPGVTEMLRDLAWVLRTRKGGSLGQPEASIAGRLLTTRGLCSREKAG